MSRTVTALYDSRSEAEEARTRLTSSRIDADRVRIIDKSSAGSSSATSGNQQQQLGDRQGSHSSGGHGGGFFSSFKDMFLPDEDSHAYSEGINRGGYMLCAQVDDNEVDEAVRILEQTNSVDFDQRQDQWRSEGWQGYTGKTPGYESGGLGTSGSSGLTGTGSSGSSSFGGASTSGSSGTENRDRTVEEEHIPIMEEQLRVGKREVNRGGARVRSYIVEQPAHETVTLREEHVSIERRPVNEAIRGDNLSGNDLLQERTVEMTETAEEAVVAKEARIKEELVIKKTAEERTEQIDETVRHTEVDVDEGMKSGSSGDRSAFGSFGSGSSTGSTGSGGPGQSSDTSRSDFERTDRDKKGF